MLKLRIAHIVAFFLLLTSAHVEAKPAASHSAQQNIYSNSYYSVTRPSDRWRFDTLDDTNMTTLRWNRYGDDLTIHIQFHDAINVIGRDRRRFKLEFWFNIFKKTMSQAYLDRQFRIVSFTPLSDNTIRIEGVNSDRDYLLVDIHFVKANYYGDYVTVETVLKTSDYLDFRDAFYSVSNSIVLN